MPLPRYKVAGSPPNPLPWDMVPIKPTLMNRLEKADDLSSTQRRIADCLKANLDEAALWGVEDLAQESQTSVATVVRFSKKLGYSGYLEMRKGLVTSARKNWQRGDQLLEAPENAAATLVEVARRDIQSIERVVRLVDQASLQRAVDLLKGSRLRLVLGDGVSSLMARHLAYLLIATGTPTLEGSPMDFATQVASLGTGDVLIAISIYPYTRETLDAAAYARSRGIPVLSFTDSTHSPLAGIADLTLLIPGKNLLFSHSLAAFGTLAHALATAIARGNPEASLKALRETEQVARAKFKRS